MLLLLLHYLLNDWLTRKFLLKLSLLQAIGALGIIIGILIKKNDFIEENNKDGVALGTGLGLAGLMLVFFLFAVILLSCKNRCFGVFVSTYLPNNNVIVWNSALHLLYNICWLRNHSSRRKK